MNQNTTTTTGGTGWNWVFAATPDSSNRVKIPPRLVEAGIFEQNSSAYWGYNQRTGTMVVSPAELQFPNIKNVDESSIGGPKDGYRSTVPHQFYPDSSGQTHLAAQKVDPTLTGDETFHFLYHDDVEQRDTSWCYVLTTTELERRILPPSEWPETVFPKTPVVPSVPV